MSAQGHILVIDDSSTLRKLIEIAFRGSPTHVDFASSGNEGVSRAVAHPPDVILLDFLLPDMRGVEVCRRLLRHSPTARVPVVVMSGNREGVAEAFRDLPQVVDFVPKPFTTDEIGRRLRAAMRSAGSANPLDAPPRLRPTTPSQASGTGLTLDADLASVPVLEVLRFLHAARAAGTLRIDGEGSPIQTHLIGGEILACSAAGRDDELELVELRGLRETELQAARAEQERSGKPAVVALAEAGLVRAADVPALLRAGTKRRLTALLAMRKGRASWSSAPPPSWVTVFGRPVSLASLALGNTRNDREVAAGGLGFLDEVLERTAHFSRAIRGAHLTAKEQSVLAVIDGTMTARRVLERASLPVDRGAALLSRLRAAGLVQPCERTTGIEIESVSPGAVAVLDPDRTGFIEPLRAHLRRRPQPVETIDLSEVADIAGTVRELRPQLVLVGGSAERAAEVLAQLEGVTRGGATLLVAVLDGLEPIDGLLERGFDAALLKPIHVNEIERLLAY